MSFTSESGLRHRGNVCERADGITYEEVYDSEETPGATFRICRVCGSCRTAIEEGDREWERAGGGCTCWVNPNPYTYNGVAEPGDALEADPECPKHFPADVDHA